MTDRTIHLFLGSLDDVDIPEIRSACAALLCASERAQAERFTSDRRRREYVFAHGLVRAALSRFAPEVAPTAWLFERTRYGRPFISYPRTAERLHFSLSHTDGCVACAVSSCERVGIDVEATDRPVSYLEISRTYFSSAEHANLIALPPAQQKDRFFDLWTLKEAYAKARGLGFQLRLNEFSIHVAPGGNRTITFSRDCGDDPKSWCLSQFCPSPRHRLAIADGSGCGLPVVSEPWPIQSQATVRSPRTADMRVRKGMIERRHS
jgi:4'-phosphopantetheinyl transferase